MKLHFFSKLIFLLFFFYLKFSFGQDATLIYKNTVNSTVTIETENGYGSGFFVAPNIIATNYHVIEGAFEASCYLNNSSTKYKIDGYLAADKSVDLVLLKVSGLNKPKLNFATETVSPGQKIYAMGSPKGLPATISDGIISGMRDFEGYKLIQMTAPISPGSSGGPVLNSKGQLIGISVSQLTDGQNLNFAIPKSYLEVLLQFKKDEPSDISTLYEDSEYEENNESSNYYDEDRTFEVGVTPIDKPELSLDYIAYFEDKTCFYFTYDMTNSNQKNQTIYMEDYRLVDLETGEIYYGQVTDLSSKDEPRVIYKGTISRFFVCFDRLPKNVKRFNLMEGECNENSFCFLGLNLLNYDKTNDVQWRNYQNNDEEGTISFYTKQNIGYIDVFIGDYKFGTLTKYFSDPDYDPDCGDTGDAMLTIRLEVGEYEYSAVCGAKRWGGTFKITKEGCHSIYFTK